MLWQAIQWFKAHMAASNTNIEVAALHDPRFANLLELAVRFGKTLVVSEVDRMDPILHPLLRRDLERQGPRMVVHVGDKQVRGYMSMHGSKLIVNDGTRSSNADGK